MLPLLHLCCMLCIYFWLTLAFCCAFVFVGFICRLHCMHPLVLVMCSAALCFRPLDPFHILLLRACCFVAAGVGSMGAGDKRCDSLRFAASVRCVLLELLVLAGLGWSFSSRRALLC